MRILLIGILIGLIPAVIAQRKGRSFIGWWIYGTLIFIIALPHALLIKSGQAAIEERQLAKGIMKKCPYCAELIKAEATICRYCGKEVPITETPIPTSPSLESLKDVFKKS